jgi:hypothetical protein
MVLSRERQSTGPRILDASCAIRRVLLKSPVARDTPEHSEVESSSRVLALGRSEALTPNPRESASGTKRVSFQFRGYRAGVRSNYL